MTPERRKRLQALIDENNKLSDELEKHRQESTKIANHMLELQKQCDEQEDEYTYLLREQIRVAKASLTQALDIMELLAEQQAMPDDSWREAHKMLQEIVSKLKVNEE